MAAGHAESTKQLTNRASAGLHRHLLIAGRIRRLKTYPVICQL